MEFDTCLEVVPANLKRDSLRQFSVYLLSCLLLLASACQPAPAESSTLKLSGAIEATEVTVVGEIGGRVIEIAADEGDTVDAGQPLVRFDDASIRVQVRQARAGVSAAEANLAQVKAGARPEAVAAAEAALLEAQAGRDGAALSYRDALDALDDPQQLLAQIDRARTGVKLAEQNVTVALSKVAEARWRRDVLAKTDPQRETMDKETAIAEREAAAAQAQLDGAQAQLKALEAMRRAPVAIQAQVNGAQGAYSMTLASVRVADTALAELKAGPAPEEIAVAEAQLHQAQAQLRLAQAVQSRAVVDAPIAGMVSSRSVNVGEIAQPGSALMSVANLDEVTLVIYVPQAELPRVQIGAPVQVTVDAYPGETFDGAVKSIARQAQFTSRDTQAAEDRANVVFAVKVRLPNGDHRLKPGMTADAAIDLSP